MNFVTSNDGSGIAYRFLSKDRSAGLFCLLPDELLMLPFPASIPRIDVQFLKPPTHRARVALPTTGTHPAHYKDRGREEHTAWRYPLSSHWWWNSSVG
jgi:hypothetical protein